MGNCRGQTERPRIKPAASNACYLKQLVKHFATAGATKVKEAKKLAAFKVGKECCGIHAHVVSNNVFWKPSPGPVILSRKNLYTGVKKMKNWRTQEKVGKRQLVHVWNKPRRVPREMSERVRKPVIESQEKRDS